MEPRRRAAQRGGALIKNGAALRRAAPSIG